MKYNAFISYRHTEPDMYVAKRLQQKLEHFKLPKSLRKNFPKERWRITRVFRDQDELSLADSLSEELEEALKDSEYLIAICSPRYKESEWCTKEIEDYKKMYGLEKILLVLVEGEPETAFPENQLYRDKTVTDETGNTVTVRENIEPLAADVRGTDNRARNKMIDEAVVRLAAMMYGLDYDELRRRHREQRIRRIAGIASICSFIFFIFGLICFSLFMRINSLKNELEDSNENLKVLNKQILENDEEIKSQNQKLTEYSQKIENLYEQEQIKHAESVADNADAYIKAGRYYEAVEALMKVMPKTKDDKEKPYIPKTEYTLTNALFEYDFNVYVFDSILPLPDEFEYDEFWGSIEEYRFLERYLAGDIVVGAGQISEDIILIITNTADFFWYNPKEYTFFNYTISWFNTEFTDNINRAVYRDGKLYIHFDKNDYVSCFVMKKRTDDQYVYDMSKDESSKLRTKGLSEDNPVLWSDDGKVRIEYTSKRAVSIFRGNEENPVNTLYDHKGHCYGIKKLNGTDYYAITFGYNGYILNENLEEIARVENYYDYSPEDNCVLQYMEKSDGTGYAVYRYPFKSYDELIAEAEKMLETKNMKIQ